MKIPITDYFLWDVYNIIIEPTSRIAGNMLSSSYKRRLLPFYDHPTINSYRKKLQRQKFHRLIYHLKTHNYIKVTNLKNKKALMITKEGIGKALRASFNIENKEKRKDGKWTMITFDVPSKNNKSRDLLRSILQNLGFRLLQKSVWVTPYDVSRKLELALQMYSLDKFVKIFLVEEL